MSLAANENRLAAPHGRLKRSRVSLVGGIGCGIGVAVLITLAAGGPSPLTLAIAVVAGAALAVWVRLADL